MKKILSLVGVFLVLALLAGLGTLAFVKSQQGGELGRQVTEAVKVIKDQQGKIKELQTEIQGLEEALREAANRVTELEKADLARQAANRAAGGGSAAGTGAGGAGQNDTAGAPATGTSPNGGLSLACPPSAVTDSSSTPPEATRYPLEMRYRPVVLRVLNNGQSIQIAAGSGSTLKVGPEIFDLASIHFHRPESGQIDGKPVAMVIHFVHRTAGGKLVVVSVPLRESAFQNRTIWNISNHLPSRGAAEATVANVSIDPMALLPESLSYQVFEGALPMPPCSPGVRFYLLRTPVGIGKDQLDRFMTRLRVSVSRT
ncbi:MAG: Carbonic anhydrase precursor [Pseudomonadota bacterium]|jgi:carbonic anhydrase